MRMVEMGEQRWHGRDWMASGESPGKSKSENTQLFSYQRERGRPKRARPRGGEDSGTKRRRQQKGARKLSTLNKRK